MRLYIRHPSSIAIEVLEPEQPQPGERQLENLGHGGLAFYSDTTLAIGTRITLRIPVTRPPFETPARVVWTQPKGKRFVIGAELLDKDAVFRARMVEQICHIEHYRREVEATEGRKLSSREAVREWITRYAARFPDLAG